MENQRRLLRLEAKDFLEIRPLENKGGSCKGECANFSLMGICFTSQVEWRRGQCILIDYFIPSELDSVKLKVSVIWSEFISVEVGYFCGGEIIDVEGEKQEKFANHYFQKLRERFF